jgi:hypothetical protein
MAKIKQKIIHIFICFAEVNNFNLMKISGHQPAFKTEILSLMEVVSTMSRLFQNCPKKKEITVDGSSHAVDQKTNVT